MKSEFCTLRGARATEVYEIESLPDRVHGGAREVVRKPPAPWAGAHSNKGRGEVLTLVGRREIKEFFQEEVIFDLGVQGIVWVRRSMKNGGKDFPDRWDSRNRSIEVKWATARSGGQSGS